MSQKPVTGCPKRLLLDTPTNRWIYRYLQVMQNLKCIHVHYTNTYKSYSQILQWGQLEKPEDSTYQLFHSKIQILPDKFVWNGWYFFQN